MRIGKDALVFTKSEKTASIGYLSQTYNKAVNADSIKVPMISYSLPGLEPFENQQSNLEAILQHSIFDQEAKLKDQLNSFEGTGTKIVIFNLHRLKNESEIFELDFFSDPKDIRCPESFEVDVDSPDDRPLVPNRTDYKISLREYCYIHFLKPRMKIFVRGQRVKRKPIEYSLAYKFKDQYKPARLKRPIPIIFGLTCDKERSEEYGMMIYNRNRLVRAFERVGCQKKGDGGGKGVIGIVEVDFFQAIHDKQHFAVDSNALMKACAQKLNDYWDAMNNIESPRTEESRELTWAMCDNCDKYRLLPAHVNSETLPDKWYCHMNPDATHNRCEIPEEPQEEPEEELAVKETIDQIKRSKRNKRGGESQTSHSSKKRKSLIKSVTPSKDNDTVRRETRGRPSSSTNLSTLSTLGESLSNENDSVIDLTDDDVNSFKVPQSVTIKTEPILSGFKQLSVNCTTTSLNMELETNQLANDDDDSDENSSLFLARANTSSLSNISQSERAENDLEIDELGGGDDSASNGENEMQDTEGEIVLEGNQDVSDESRQSNSGSPRLEISTSENQDIDGGNTNQILLSIGTEINPPMEEISENHTSATQREEEVSNRISHDFLMERLKQAKLERDEYATKLQRLKENVYRLLQLQAPDKNLGDVEYVDELLEDVIREKSQAVDSPDL